jgi:hypothetical protein
MKTIIVLICAAGLLVLPVSAAAQTQRPAVTGDCLHYAGHVYEVCTAFVFNCTTAAMLPYFKYAHSPNRARAIAAKYRLESRYIGQARRKLESMVSKWPSGEAHVRLTRLSITSARSSLATNSATLHVKWSWFVFFPNGQFRAETNHPHTISMRRVPGLILHKWVVAGIS